MAGDPSSWHFVSYFALKPEAQAAWAQAILSVVALAVAIGAPMWHAKKLELDRQRRLVSALHNIVLLAIGVANQMEDALEDQESRASALRNARSDELSPLVKAADDLPTQDFSNLRTMRALFETRNVVSGLRYIWNDFASSGPPTMSYASMRLGISQAIPRLEKVRDNLKSDHQLED